MENQAQKVYGILNECSVLQGRIHALVCQLEDYERLEEWTIDQEFDVMRLKGQIRDLAFQLKTMSASIQFIY